MSVIRKGLTALLVLVLVATVLGLTLGLDWLFARAVRSGGAAALGAPVDFDGAGFALFSGRATVDGFHGGTAEHPLLDFEHAALQVSPGAALGGRVQIDEATLDGLVLHLVIDEQGKLGWDPGPPPADTEPAQDAPPAPPAEPAEDADLVQILREYALRLRTYKEYYDKYGGVFGGDGDAEEGPAAERVRWPGKPEAVRLAQAEDAAAAAAQGVFWLAEAAISDFSWNTLDQRNGEPLLPALSSCSLNLSALGTPPDGSTPPSEVRGEATFAAGGELGFALALSRDGSPHALTLNATGLLLVELMPLAGQSFPFKIEDGTVDVVAEEFRFAADSLDGSVRLRLAGARLSPKPDSPKVLGVRPGEFCRLLNAALEAVPVEFVLRVGGSPGRPTFRIENESEIGDALGGAIRAEVERRAREFVDEQRQELEEEGRNRLEGLIDEKVGGDLGDKLKEEAGRIKIPGLGGDRKKKD